VTAQVTRRARQKDVLIATLPTDRMPAILEDADWDLRLRGTPDEAVGFLLSRYR
jgi:hypothetical protein